MRLDDGATVILIVIQGLSFEQCVSCSTTVVVSYILIVTLAFYRLESGEKAGTAHGVFEQTQSKACKDAAEADGL